VQGDGAAHPAPPAGTGYNDAMTTHSHQKHNLLRSIAGVLVGFLLFALGLPLVFRLLGTESATSHGGFMALAVVLGIGLSLLGGFLAAWIAHYRARLHAGVVAGLIAITAIFSLLLQADWIPGWSQIAALFLMTPAAQIGGRLRAPRRHE
jgi:uncharacterized membrane protein